MSEWTVALRRDLDFLSSQKCHASPPGVSPQRPFIAPDLGKDPATAAPASAVAPGPPTRLAHGAVRRCEYVDFGVVAAWFSKIKKPRNYKMNTIYDLISPGRDYQPVYDYIEATHFYARPLESLWLIRTNKSAATVRDELKELVDTNDKVLTVDVTGDGWATNFSDAHTDWMKKHISGATPLHRAA
jgi:hypothetical protein